MQALLLSTCQAWKDHKFDFFPTGLDVRTQLKDAHQMWVRKKQEREQDGGGESTRNRTEEIGDTWSLGRKQLSTWG